MYLIKLFSLAIYFDVYLPSGEECRARLLEWESYFEISVVDFRLFCCYTFAYGFDIQFGIPREHFYITFVLNVFTIWDFSAAILRSFFFFFFFLKLRYTGKLYYIMTKPLKLDALLKFPGLLGMCLLHFDWREDLFGGFNNSLSLSYF